jgi:hypothetical protein
MNTTATVISHLQHWLTRSAPNPATDATLVRRFVKEGDDATFAALVDRHGPMVLGVARRVVGDHHTAEDIFQVTFLVLARRARHLRHPGPCRRGSITPPTTSPSPHCALRKKSPRPQSPGRCPGLS